MNLFLGLVFLSRFVTAQWLVGYADNSILPTVNGRQDYFNFTDPYDLYNPGTFVDAFDDGYIEIGNGYEAHFVHDDIRTCQLALRNTASSQILLIIHSDLYMIFENDLDDYKAQVRAALGDDTYNNIVFLPTTTHSHSGPDTSGIYYINRNWYGKMLTIMAQTSVQAIAAMQPATIRVAQSEWRFGLGDNRDPNLFDPVLNVLQATSTASGRVIVTLVQWAQHVESLLHMDFRVPDAVCELLGQPIPCYQRDSVISADYPGYLHDLLEELTDGGGVVYINGAIGVQVGVNGAPIWDVTNEFPITGDGSVPPPGAPLLPDESHLSSYICGRELAFQVVRMLAESGEDLPPSMSISTINYYSRMVNVGFRAGMVALPTNPPTPLLIGYTMRDLFICSDPESPSDATCVHDNYETVVLRDNGGVGVPVRLGEFFKSTLMHVRLGENLVQIQTLNGEIAPEMVHGVPADFDDEVATLKYYDWPTSHVKGVNYTFDGVVKDMMKCRYCFIFGAAIDHGGYVFPLSDYRSPCETQNSYTLQRRIYLFFNNLLYFFCKVLPL
jgi:hypothetical protein